MSSQLKGIIWIALFAGFVITLIKWEDWSMIAPIVFGVLFIAFSIYASQTKST